MAKSARSSAVKRNNANLRRKIFGPAVDARTERLSAKLQELAAKPRPDQDKFMDVDGVNVVSEGHTDYNAREDADEDVEMKNVTSTKRKSTAKKSTSKITKKSIRKKPRNQIIFPTSDAKRKRIAQSKKKSVH